MAEAQRLTVLVADWQSVEEVEALIRKALKSEDVGATLYRDNVCTNCRRGCASYCGVCDNDE